jgi:hypothetical protein
MARSGGFERTGVRTERVRAGRWSKAVVTPRTRDFLLPMGKTYRVRVARNGAEITRTAVVIDEHRQSIESGIHCEQRTSAHRGDILPILARALLWRRCRIGSPQNPRREDLTAFPQHSPSAGRHPQHRRSTPQLLMVLLPQTSRPVPPGRLDRFGGT